MRNASAALAVVWLILIGTPSAYAYLDPGTGSMILQVVLGGVAGLVVALRLYWHRILAMMGIRQKPVPEEAVAEAPSSVDQQDDAR